MEELGLREARYWEKSEGGRVHCLLCPHGCRPAEGQVGRCRVRRNHHGVLHSLNYGRISAAHLDPIEKKPLFHFHPGSIILSLGTVGCNLACTFCQNWSISQTDAGTRPLSPEQAVKWAGAEPDNIGLAYTYNEPMVWYEFVLETAQLAREAGLKNVLVTNGYVREEPLRELLPFVDAMNVDVKSMQEKFYQELCRGKPEPPRRTVEVAKEAGCAVEVTNLVIPGWNDSGKELRALTDWLAGIDPDLPLHFSRYHPDYKLSEQPTPAQTLLHARDLARERLHYVYVGNLPQAGGEDTLCPGCGKTVVARRGYEVSQISVTGGHCDFCGGGIPIVGT